MLRFQEKIAIVTGGGSGIGRATCHRLAAEGATVVIAEIDFQSGEQTAQEIRQSGGMAEFIATDIADESSVCRLVDITMKKFKGIHILVNNAAVFVLQGIDASADQWQEILSTNIMGTAFVVKHVAPKMRDSGGGAIVNLGSISSFIGQPEFVTYNTTKTAILGMTRCLALDLAPDKIRVNAVCPGTVWTPIVERLTDKQGLDRAAADAHPDWGGKHMLHRLADPEEIAAAIAFLASEDASFITGESLLVDGGYVAQ